jgi:hypothetical protein
MLMTVRHLVKRAPISRYSARRSRSPSRGNGGCAAAEASDVGAFGGRGSSQHDTVIESRIG